MWVLHIGINYKIWKRDFETLVILTDLSAFEGCSKRIIEYTGTVDDTLTKVKTISSQLQTILDQQSKQSGTNSQMQQTIKQLNNLSKELQGAVSNSLQG